MLYDQGLSVSTIDKALAGDFSEATLDRIEAILGTKFAPKSNVFAEQASEDLGSYTFKAVEHLQGDYLVLRPCFSNVGRLNVYGISIKWDENEACLLFEEKQRSDVKYTQRGRVYVPFGKPFFSLVTIAKGSVRLINLYLPEEDGICRGVISTLHNPMAASFQPATCPIVLKRISIDELNDGVAAAGFVSSEMPQYTEYKDLLDGVIGDGYAVLVTGADFVERRKPLALVS
ncbi:hypothetical protein [Mesorhizobium sp. WSM4887]|uniref:hypothetical protein n=1 Tax=Mesorhizobium sp. WSM4887 TaxID=3038543 RepID=UPI0012EA03C6|nr:hypothetical protein [Mesorhizobium sp. WSM4887]MDG4886861.1 hypothetical protein [Mesorhizobium sp. WSM4887]